MNRFSTQIAFDDKVDIFSGIVRPAYRQLLPFFENLYQIQESAVASACPEGLESAALHDQQRQAADAPLLARDHLPIDMASAKQTLRSICDAAIDANPKLADAGTALGAWVDEDEPMIEAGLASFAENDQETVNRLGKALGIEMPVLHFFLSHSIWPSLARVARRLKAQAAIEAPWQHRYCPVCGDAPILAYLSENGKRILVCGLCRHQWALKRILCPHCGNDRPDTIGYFFSDNEPAYRVVTCDACNTYIKTIDTRQLPRPFYPPLEDLVTYHLDLRAAELGYQKREDRLVV